MTTHEKIGEALCDATGFTPETMPIGRIVNKYKTSVAICNALGLDASRVATLKIILDGGMPRVEVVYPLYSDQTDAIGKSLGEFALVPKDTR